MSALSVSEAPDANLPVSTNLDDRHCIRTSPRGSGDASLHCAKHELSSTSARQADGRLAALAARALGIWRDSWIRAAHRGWSLEGLFSALSSAVPGSDSAISDYYCLGARRLCRVSAATREVKGRGWRKIVSHQRSDAAARVQSSPASNPVCRHGCEDPRFPRPSSSAAQSAATIGYGPGSGSHRFAGCQAQT